jgi:formate-dependent nitrite reductase membrane component NrfD
MLIVSSAADLFWGKGEVFALGSLLAGVIIALGSGLLLFDLGRPLQFWRVLSRQKAVMTVGSWMLTCSIVTSLIYFSFWLGSSAWRDLVGLRHTLAWINSLMGLGVCIYTGILLGSMKARPFWSTPALPVLFLVSGLSTGIAGQSLLAGVWPYAGVKGLEATHSLLKFLDLALIFFELVIILVYVFMMRTSFGEDVGRIADSWLMGKKKFAFWGGLIGLGLLLPGVLYLMADRGIGQSLAIAGVLFGGLILRFLIVYSDEQKKLPGEV